MTAVCSICEKVFSETKNLKRHMKNVHKIDVETSCKITCPVCHQSLVSYNKLREHICQQHNIQLESSKITFKTKADFMLWKETEEKNDRSFYAIKQEGKVLKDGSKKSYYYCNRSGTFTSKSSGIRMLKAQGTCKMGSHCPSTLEVIEKDEIFVTHYKTHVGHERELKHLFLSRTEKEELSRKLSQGITFERCLKDVRDTIGNKIERIHLLTRKDLQNIATANVESFKRHENDAVSLQLFVNEMDDLKDHSPVAFYKPQGIVSENLEKHDFLLVIFTDIQKDLFIKFGGEKICIDSTHGTNMYEFYLTTIVVVDEFNNGFPVAFCLSNRITGIHMEKFFQAIKFKIGDLKTKIFMSDDAPAYYNSWKQVFGEAERHILCSWHIERNWRQALSKVTGHEKKIAVYKYLRTMLEETDKEKFKKLLENFLKESEEDPEVKNFGIYFKNNYANRCEQWAYCYRLLAGINSNMYLEAFHKVLKYIYMKGKKNKRIDFLISHLLNFVRDKAFDRYIKLVKGVTSKKTCEIHERHKRSTKITQNIKQTDTFKWSVTSEKNNKIQYNVKKNELENNHSCELQCRMCCTCIHCYTCTCIDAIVRGNMCKHIHAVETTLSNLSKSIPVKKEIEIVNEIESSSGFEDLSLNSKMSSKSSEDILLRSKIDIMLSLLNKKSISETKKEKIHKNIDNIIQILNSEENIKQKNNEPPNKKIKLQTRLFSTKNKIKKSSKESISKPSTSYKLSLLNYITNTESYDSEMDHSYAKPE